MNALSSNAPLYGLVLAGGASTRMQRDKAALDFHGRPQLCWAYALLTARCAHSYVSVRATQAQDEARAAMPRIADQHEGIGPLAGIVAAQQRHPEAAWLVLACDLPFVDGATLDALIAARDPGAPATAFRSAHDGLPEPLCAIYEPSTAPELLRRALQGPHCPRKFLIQSAVPLLALPEPGALDNVNTPGDLADARQRLAR